MAAKEKKHAKVHIYCDKDPVDPKLPAGLTPVENIPNKFETKDHFPIKTNPTYVEKPWGTLAEQRQEQAGEERWVGVRLIIHSKPSFHSLTLRLQSQFLDWWALAGFYEHLAP